jgi:hypothetical protein
MVSDTPASAVTSAVALDQLLDLEDGRGKSPVRAA